MKFKCIVPGCEKTAERQDEVSTCAGHWGACFICGNLQDERHDHTPAQVVEVQRREKFDTELRGSLTP